MHVANTKPDPLDCGQRSRLSCIIKEKQTDTVIQLASVTIMKRIRRLHALELSEEQAGASLKEAFTALNRWRHYGPAYRTEIWALSRHCQAFGGPERDVLAPMA